VVAKFEIPDAVKLVVEALVETNLEIVPDATKRSVIVVVANVEIPVTPNVPPTVSLPYTVEVPTNEDVANELTVNILRNLLVKVPSDRAPDDDGIMSARRLIVLKNVD
jgi:hypothetical protein